MPRFALYLALALYALTACAGPSRVAPPVVRVVSLHDVTSELVVALGAVDRMVGVIEPVDVEADTTAAIARVPRVGDLESILAVHPTLVVGLAVVAAQDPGLVARLREAGVVVYLGDPMTLDDVTALIGEVAGRVGAARAGDTLAARFAATVHAGESPPRAAAAPGPASPRHRPRVFVYDCCDPPFTTGHRTVLDDMIRRAGGDNVFADLDAGWTHVSWEAVVERRPELVVIHAYHFEGQGEVPDKQRAVAAIAPLAGLPTVIVPLGCSLGGLRSLEGLARLRAVIGGRA